MGIRSADFRPHIQEVKYLLDTCIIAAILNQEQGHRHLEDRIVAAPPVVARQKIITSTKSGPCRVRSRGGSRKPFVLGPAQPQTRKPDAKNVAVPDRGRFRNSARGLKLAKESSIAAAQVFQHPGRAVPEESSMAA